MHDYRKRTGILPFVAFVGFNNFALLCFHKLVNMRPRLLQIMLDLLDGTCHAILLAKQLHNKLVLTLDEIHKASRPGSTRPGNITS